MSNWNEYFALVKARPDLFRNPPDAGFEILLDEAGISHAEERTAERLQSAGAPREWARVGVAFRDQYGLILRDAVRYADGSVGTYIRMVAPPFPGVVILPLWQGQVVLIRHFRHATRSWHLEIPRGFGTDADVRESARRELEEEIGASGIRLTELGDMYPDTGVSDSRVALFYAEISAYGQPETIEAITHISPTPVTEFERMIGDNKLDDGFVLAAYARAKARNLL
jgi:ADP-ribose pyrophosphatase